MSNMVVATNVLAINSHRALKQVGTRQAKASARLSSGYRVNSAADDAAGLAISEKMRAQIRGLDMASKNGQDAISLIQTAEGGMQEVDNMIQRIRELVVQVSNDTNENNSVGTGDRQKIQDEINQLVEEIDSMSERVEFNKKKVINGSFADTKAVLSAANLELLNATTNQGAAQSKFDAIVAAIGNSTTGLTKALDDAKADFDTEQSAFNAASKLYAEQGVTFEGNKATYEAAKAALQAYINANPGLSEPTGTIDNTSAWDTVPANAAALNTYLAAAKAYGAEEFGMIIATGASAPTTVTTLNRATELYDPANPAATGQIGTYYVTQKGVYDAAKADYDAALTAYKNAQASYDKGIQQKETANAELAASNLVRSSAASKHSAAVEADATGAGNKLFFQVGANANQSLMQSIGSVKSNMLGIGDGKGVSNINVVKDTGLDTTAYLDVLDTALSYVTTERSKLGAVQNRLEYTIKSLDISSENLTASESRIRDTDMAKEMMNLTQANVLQQAATAMLAQANQAPQSVLQLLQ